MDTQKKSNPLQKVIDDSGLSMSEISRQSKVSRGVLYKLCQGEPYCYRRTALKLVKYFSGKLKLEDFGYE